MALWRLSNEPTGEVVSDSGVYSVIKPVQVSPCKNSLRVRALGLNRNKKVRSFSLELLILSILVILGWRVHPICACRALMFSLYSLRQMKLDTSLNRRKIKSNKDRINMKTGNKKGIH